MGVGEGGEAWIGKVGERVEMMSRKVQIIRIHGLSDGAGGLNGTVLEDSGLGYGASVTWVVGGGIETTAVYYY